jgi:hypothetical protein
VFFAFIVSSVSQRDLHVPDEFRPAVERTLLVGIFFRAEAGLLHARNPGQNGNLATGSRTQRIGRERMSLKDQNSSRQWLEGVQPANRRRHRLTAFNGLADEFGTDAGGSIEIEKFRGSTTPTKAWSRRCSSSDAASGKLA